MNDDNGSSVVWFLVGASVGAAIALLYAPATGEETRRQLTKRAADGRDSLADSGKELMDRGRELYEKGRRLADDAAEMFDQGRKAVGG